MLDTPQTGLPRRCLVAVAGAFDLEWRCGSYSAPPAGLTHPTHRASLPTRSRPCRPDSSRDALTLTLLVAPTASLTQIWTRLASGPKTLSARRANATLPRSRAPSTARSGHPSPCSRMMTDSRRASPQALPSPRLHPRQAFAPSFRCSLDPSCAAVTPLWLAPTCRRTASANRTALEHPFELPNPSRLRAEARRLPDDCHRRSGHSPPDLDFPGVGRASRRLRHPPRRPHALTDFPQSAAARTPRVTSSCLAVPGTGAALPPLRSRRPPKRAVSVWLASLPEGSATRGRAASCPRARTR